MSTSQLSQNHGLSRQAEEQHLARTLTVVKDNLDKYGLEVSRMQEDIDEMLAHYHDNDTEVLTILNNTVTLHSHMKRALLQNQKALHKPYFGRIIFRDESLGKEESLYIGKAGISQDATHQIVIDWRAPVANAYYENGLGKCSYKAPGNARIKIDLLHKRTYEIESGKLEDYFDSEVIANDDLLTKYLAKNKQKVLNEIVATIQKEQNEIIRKSPYHNIIVQGVAGSGKTTVAMHRISYILYNYEERFKPDDFYIVGSNRILLNYITGVLPDLDVYGVRQMTMEQLFIRLLYEDWDKKKYHIINSAADSVKSTAQWFADLEAYCHKIERKTISCRSVYLNPEQFTAGKIGSLDETASRQADPRQMICLLDGDAIERYIRQNPAVSVQNKINMLNKRLRGKIKEEFLNKGIKYTEAERKAILKAYRGYYGGRVWKYSIFEMYHDFLTEQNAKGYHVSLPDTAFDVYDLAALAYLYKRIKETETISEAHHIVIDEAQDFGMMAYLVLKFCIYRCTYTVMGDVSQNIRFGCGLNDWEELKKLLLANPSDSFGILKKSYRNTVEISNFATDILHHGQFFVYPVEPILRHGRPVEVRQLQDRDELIRTAARICRQWQEGHESDARDTIAIVCRSQTAAASAARELSSYINVMESDPEKTVFGNGIMVLSVEYTKGLEFDAVLILDPTREEYPVDDGHSKLLYVAATRALHELCVLHTGSLTGLIADPVPARRKISIVVNEPTAKEQTGQKPVRPHNGHLQEQRSNLPKPTAAMMPQQPALPKPQPATKPQQPAPSKLQPVMKQDGKQTIPSIASGIRFGDMPVTEKLRPAGHGRIDLAVRWVTKQPDGLYLHSRYGILRLSPVGSAIVRVTFTRGGQITEGTHPGIAVQSTDKRWMYKDSGSTVDLMTDELYLQVSKANGAIRYMTRDKKLLLAERDKECRQLESTPGGLSKTWLYLNWGKNENLFAMGAGAARGFALQATARYISHTDGSVELPLLLSDKGYGLLPAADCPVLCCTLPAYGSYLHLENAKELDFYFITGKRQHTILSAYAYLCGKL